jgi:repressor LexA
MFSNTEISLTDRQRQLLDFLRQHQRENGVMPSTREIQRYFGFASQTAAMSHLRALQKKGVIQRHSHMARAVVFPEDLDRPEILDIPVFGTIPAGYAANVEPEQEGSISVDINTLGVPKTSRTFALRVRGDSMVNAHILDGDHVIMEVKEPRRNDIVAALIDGETTLKRYVVESGRTYLKAENPAYPDLIPTSELIIQGVFLALIRNTRAR